MSKNPDKYFDSQYFPANVSIREPSKMVEGDFALLHQFWIDRQTRNEPPFRFKDVIQSHRRPEPEVLKKKTPAVYVEVDDQPEGSRVSKSKTSQGDGSDSDSGTE